MATKATKSTDEILLEALTKAYTSRAKLFYKRTHSKHISSLSQKVAGIDSSSLDWNLEELNISKTAFERTRKLG
ncbi:MAG: hypothetical protein ACE5HI_14430, partial [bacterium]